MYTRWATTPAQKSIAFSDVGVLAVSVGRGTGVAVVRRGVAVPYPGEPTLTPARGGNTVSFPSQDSAGPRTGPTRHFPPRGNAMGDRPERPTTARSSRQRYRAFVQDYKARRLDDAATAGEDPAAPTPDRPARRREFLRAYLRWLRPHRYAVAGVFLIALIVAGMEMVEPLFMRFIIDRVLLNPVLDPAARISRLHMVGAVFLGAVILGKLIGIIKDYRQR